MIGERLVHVPLSERGAADIKKGAVFFIIDPVTKRIVYGRQKRDNGRGLVNEIGVNGEGYEDSDIDIITTFARGVVEELDWVNAGAVRMGVNILDHYLGEAWFGDNKDVLAYIFWAFGNESDFISNENSGQSKGPEDDFEFMGFTTFEQLIAMNKIRPGMKCVFETLNQVGFGKWLAEQDFGNHNQHAIINVRNLYS